MSTTNKKQIVEKFYEVLNSGQTEKLQELIDENFKEHTPDPMFPPEKGPEYVAEIIKTYRQAFPDLKVTIKDIVEEGDFMASRIELTGTNTGEIQGSQPTHKKIKIEGFDIGKFSNGKITDHWGVWDYFAMMQQLGIVPEESQAGANH
jgi:predicted ester cyclase